MNTETNAICRTRVLCAPAFCTFAIISATSAAIFALDPYASAQWITFSDQTGTRIPTGAGQNDPALTTACPEEKDYAWGDVDHDGDLDLVCPRKRPLSCEGGRRMVLYMNEGGVLIDRASTKGVAALNGGANGVPAAQGTSQGFLDQTNTRQAVLVDVDNDGWLDIVTAPTLSDGLHRYIGYPRVYMNLKDSGGVWQGFRYEYARIPNMLNSDTTVNPRFCSVAAGDVTNDGFVDLYFSDYDTPENAYCPLIFESGNDFNNRLLINQGAANPGFFSDESSTRMGATTGDTGGNLLTTAFGTHGVIADMNGDGVKDVARVSTLGFPQHIAILTNPPGNPGTWTSASYKVVYNFTPYSISVDDMNNDGRLDLVITEDAADRFGRNDGNDASTPFGPNFTTFSLAVESGFSGQSTIADLDNDGWKDAIITDQDIDTNFVTSRRAHIYHNLGAGAPSQQIVEDNANPVIPQSEAKAVYNAAIFDIDGDGWKDVVLGKGLNGFHVDGSTQVWMNNGKPGLTFTYPAGRPANLIPNQTTTFNVQITGNHGGVLTGNPVVFSATNNGSFTSTPLISLGGSLYQVNIAAQPCSADVRYYLSAQVTAGATFTDPAGGPANFYNATAYSSTVNLLTENFEGAAPGWTVQNDAGLTSGAWALGDPAGTWNEGYKAAPEDDATAAGTKAYVTGLSGALAAQDVDGGATHLISPTFDLAGSNGIVSFKRWFYSSTQNDVLQVSVSNNNGGSWVNVTSYKPPPVTYWYPDSSYVQTSWVTGSFVVSDYVTPTSTVKVRFSVNDTTPAGFVEAGIDDFIANKTDCAGNSAVVECITYTTFESNPRALRVTIKIVDGSNIPVPGAVVSAVITGAATSFTVTGTTGADGTINFLNRPTGFSCFTTDVTSVVKSGYVFSGSEPANGFQKGVDTSPDSDCVSANDPCGSG